MAKELAPQDQKTFPGVWMNLSGTLLYRLVPKCACSTIGQLLYYTDNKEFFDGDVHDAKAGMHKWAFEDSHPAIIKAVEDGVFTCSAVRNPFSRVLSAYSDKIMSVQRNGKYYNNQIRNILSKRYGFKADEPGDHRHNFLAFAKMVRDAYGEKFKQGRDIHWAPASNHLATLVRRGGHYDVIGQVENLRPMLDASFRKLIPARVLAGKTPVFNESRPEVPIDPETVWSDEAIAIARDVYRKDFDLFHYDAQDPKSKKPLDVIDPARVAQALGKRG